MIICKCIFMLSWLSKTLPMCFHPLGEVISVYTVKSILGGMNKTYLLEFYALKTSLIEIYSFSLIHY
ncbi:hypothetical protein EUGRSUZ_H04747 [Eucalyptus grandis]|uniref:Uncharacterized protein n=2 Tax=Eucalyptus grandis TaxID=71139 RepID=A0ACC3JY20_EUCGR|nr:hypothetical protein EUGRSUZ_H04747 [Eucalyptus grandis]